MTGKLFTVISLGAQVRREVGRFLSKQLPGLRTLFPWARTQTSQLRKYGAQSNLDLNIDIYLQFRFISVLKLTYINLYR